MAMVYVYISLNYEKVENVQAQIFITYVAEWICIADTGTFAHTHVTYMNLISRISALMAASALLFLIVAEEISIAPSNLLKIRRR